MLTEPFLWILHKFLHHSLLAPPRSHGKHEGTEQESIKTNRRQLFTRGMKKWSHFILRFYEACNKWIRCQLKNHIKWFRSIHTRASFIHGSLHDDDDAVIFKRMSGKKKKTVWALIAHTCLINKWTVTLALVNSRAAFSLSTERNKILSAWPALNCLHFLCHFWWRASERASKQAVREAQRENKFVCMHNERKIFACIHKFLKPSTLL